MENKADVAAEKLGLYLLDRTLQEIRALPDVWEKLPEWQQAEVIDRVRAGVIDAVAGAVRIISSRGFDGVVCEIDSIQIKGEIKAALIVSRANGHETLQQFYDAQGQPCVIVLANPEEFSGGMGTVRAEPDQRAMKLSDGGDL